MFLLFHSTASHNIGHHKKQKEIKIHPTRGNVRLMLFSQPRYYLLSLVFDGPEHQEKKPGVR